MGGPQEQWPKHIGKVSPEALRFMRANFQKSAVEIGEAALSERNGMGTEYLKELVESGDSRAVRTIAEDALNYVEREGAPRRAALERNKK